MSVRPYEPEVARRTCRYFLRKTDYYANDGPPAPPEEVGPEYPWCDRTAEVVGPDGDPVLSSTCSPGRPCFVAILRSPPDGLTGGDFAKAETP